MKKKHIIKQCDKTNLIITWLNLLQKIISASNSHLSRDMHETFSYQEMK